MSSIHPAPTALPATAATPTIADLLERERATLDAAEQARFEHSQAYEAAQAIVAPAQEASRRAAIRARNALATMVDALWALYRQDREHPALVELRSITPAAAIGPCCRYGRAGGCVCGDAWKCPLHGRVCGGSHD